MKEKSGRAKCRQNKCRRRSGSDPPAVFGGKKIRIVLEGLRGEENISELCRRRATIGCRQFRAPDKNSAYASLSVANRSSQTVDPPS
jgi:hypothetical protein